jgi:hypothetical protein
MPNAVSIYAILSALGSVPTPPELMFATANVNSFSQPSPESGKEGETNPNLPVRGTFLEGKSLIALISQRPP